MTPASRVAQDSYGFAFSLQSWKSPVASTENLLQMRFIASSENLLERIGRIWRKSNRWSSRAAAVDVVAAVWRWRPASKVGSGTVRSFALAPPDSIARTHELVAAWRPRIDAPSSAVSDTE